MKKEIIKKGPKYYLDFSPFNKNVYRLLSIETGDEIYTGFLSDAGIEEDDDQWTNKLDHFFKKELGILPSEWEVG